ncbi:Fc.00g105690.m01.CDS01 [Cosmosporella sp. VM-42]
MSSPAFALGCNATNSIRPLPPNSYLVHATNCIAEWGAGIAGEMAVVFPPACHEYQKFCNTNKANSSTRWPSKELAGQCLIIPPQQADIDGGAPGIHIVCLFTSYGYGRPNGKRGKPGRNSMGKVLAQTQTSLERFREQLGAGGNMRTDYIDDGDMKIYSPMFNSGAFRVLWDKTERFIGQAFAGFDGQWLVMAPP